MCCCVFEHELINWFVGLLLVAESLSKLGVTGVVNMCYEYSGPKNSYSSLGIKQLHIPVVDHYEPSVDDLLAATEFITNHQKQGGRVYVTHSHTTTTTTTTDTLYGDIYDLIAFAGTCMTD